MKEVSIVQGKQTCSHEYLDKLKSMNLYPLNGTRATSTILHSTCRWLTDPNVDDNSVD
jgi:hypothetical protein